MSDASQPPRRGRGRPRLMTRVQVASAALDLFARNGFDETTVDDVAAELGIGRRTLFRYFESKNDMVWGDFDLVLARLRRLLDGTPEDLPVMEAVAQAAIESNRYEPEQLPELLVRMRLITTVPTLVAHSMVRYAEWRAVIAEFVARRLGEEPDDLVPLTVGYAALGTSMAAFTRWVAHPEEDIDEHLRRGYDLLARGLSPSVDSGGRRRRR